MLAVGLPLGAPAPLLAGLGIAYTVGWIIFFWYWKKFHFYRDPKRSPAEAGDDVIVSPADGRVMYIRRVEGGEIVSEKLGEKIPLTEITKFPGAEELAEGWLIGVYMSPGDVHFNYNPAEGRVRAIYRHQAKVNLPMVDMWEYVNFMLFRRAVNLFSRRFHFENERASLLMERADGLKYVVVLIADKFVNKIRLSVEEGARLPKSGKLGFIDRGSQADLFIADPDIEIVTKVGRQVYGGKTTLARAAVRTKKE